MASENIREKKFMLREFTVIPTKIDRLLKGRKIDRHGSFEGNFFVKAHFAKRKSGMNRGLWGILNFLQ